MAPTIDALSTDLDLFGQFTPLGIQVFDLLLNAFEFVFCNRPCFFTVPVTQG